MVRDGAEEAPPRHEDSLQAAGKKKSSIPVLGRMMQQSRGE
jgi:hypothetical protein